MHQRKLVRWSNYLLGLVGIVSLLILLGWRFDVALLKRPIPGLGAMNPLAALQLILFSIALLLALPAPRPPVRIRIGNAMMIALVLVNVYHLASLAFAIPLRLDHHVFSDAVISDGVMANTSSMSPATAVNFILLGIAALLVRKNVTLFHTLTMVSFLFSWIYFLGFFYDVPELFGPQPFAPLAIYTANCFLLLSLAILISRPHLGWVGELTSHFEGGILARIMIPIALLVPVVLGYIRLWGYWLHYISAEMGVALLVTSIIIVFVVSIVLATKLLNRRNREKDSLTKELAATVKKLEKTNEEVAALNEELQTSIEEYQGSNEELLTLNKQLEDAKETIAAQKDEQLNRVLDSSLDVIWSIDLSGKGEDYLSRSAEKLFGEPITKEMIRNPDAWTARTHPDDKIIRTSAMKTLELSGVSTATYRIRIANGQYIWIEQRSQLIRNEEGKAIRFLGMLSNVSDFKRQEQVIRQSELNFQTIFDHTDVSFLLLDKDYNIKVAKNVFNHLPWQRYKVGSNILDVSPDDRKVILKNYLQRAANNERVVYNTSYKTEGGVRYFLATLTAVFEDNLLSGFCLTTQEITELKKAEEETKAQKERLELAYQELNSYKNNLEIKIEERTHELHEALRGEKEAIELKKKFVSIASHEFRTPLSTISLIAGFLRLYRQKLSEEEVTGKLDAIENQIHHMTELLEDILTIGKADAGKTEVQLSKIQLEPFFRKLALEVQENRNTHEIKMIIEGSVSEITSDKKLLRNIMTNLFTNAIKFSPSKKSILSKIVATEELLTIEVTDQGIGIAADDQEAIFNSFQRGTNVGTIQGTGLGLSILKNAVELLKGTIQLKSEINKGTTFVITLPTKPS